MPDLTFSVASVRPVVAAATPHIGIALRVDNKPAEQVIHSIGLQCQIDIEPARRRYQPGEQAAMSDLFGEPERWHTSLHRLHWAQVPLTVAGFAGSTSTELRLPCTFDFNVAATKYLHALIDGDIPTHVAFTGSVFYVGADGRLQVEPIPWDRDASVRIPAAIWRDLMRMHYPDAGWISLRWDSFERLNRYRRTRGLTSWEETIETMLDRETGVTA